MKKIRGAAEIFAGFWGLLLGVRIILVVARSVGVVGAFETLVEWAGYPEAITHFEDLVDSFIEVIVSYFAM